METNEKDKKDKEDKEEENNKLDLINSYNFNQDFSFICMGTKNGYEIINTLEPKIRYKKKLGGEIKIIEMFNSSNILALVGGRENPKFPENKLIIWDDYKNKKIAELIFLSSVKKVIITQEKIFVLAGPMLLVFTTDYFEEIDGINISSGNKLFTVSKNNDVLAYVCSYGEVCVKNLWGVKKNENNVIKIERGVIFIKLNNNGTLIAIITENKKLILYKIKQKIIIDEIDLEFNNKSEINDVEFNNKSNFLLVSLKDKIIIYSINKKNDDETLMNIFFKQHILSIYSICDINNEENQKKICCFKGNNVIFVNETGKVFLIDFKKIKGDKCIYEEIK